MRDSRNTKLVIKNKSLKAKKTTKLLVAMLILVGSTFINTLTPHIQKAFAAENNTTCTNLSSAVAAAAAGDTLTVIDSCTQTINIPITKNITIQGANNATISTSGTVKLFTILTAGVKIQNLNFVKTDKASTQNLVGIQASNTTISNNKFSGQYTVAQNDHTSRALEVSGAVTGLTISGNTFNSLRQPAYINSSVSGIINNNYVNETRGWVILANTNLSFAGNTWGNNAVDIAFIDSDQNPNTQIVPNNYSCQTMAAIKSANNGAEIDNQLLTLPCPVVPTVSINVPREGGVAATTRHNNTLAITGSFKDDKAVNYLQLELVKAGNLVTVYTMHYNNPGLKADGSFAVNVPVPASLESDNYSLYYTGTDFDGGVTQRFERKFIIDNTSPATTLVAPTGLVGNNFTVSGVATDNQSLSRVYVQLVNRQNSQRYGGTTIHLNGTEQSWSRTFNATDLNLPDGQYATHVAATDSVGNSTNVGWSANFTVDKTVPIAPTNLRWTTSSSSNIPNGGATRLSNGTASWVTSESSDVSHYIYKYWNDIEGNPYKPGNEYRVRVDGSSLPGSFTEGEGVHHFCVETVDNAGNTSSCEQFTITYDETDPELSVVSPAIGATVINNGQTITVNGSVNDDISGMNRVVMFVNNSNNGTRQVFRDFDSSNGGEFSFTIPAGTLAVGSHQLVVNAYDNAGNSTVSRVSFTVAQPAAQEEPETPAEENPDNTNGDGETESPNAPDTALPPGSADTSSTGQPAGTIPQPAFFQNFAATLTDDGTVSAVPTTENSEDTDGEVLGAEDNLAQNAASADSEKKDLKFFGVNWYWLPAGLAGFAALWWLLGLLRRRNNQA